MAKVKITDTILRDAHQSQAATRMRIEEMLPICPQLDKVGYYSLECWGGATFDSCLRFLNEDPWERLRKLRKALPNTKLQMLLRGQNILGKKHGGIAEVAMSYTISRVHTEEYFIKLAQDIEAMGADLICIKDMANLLLPYAAFSLVSKLKKFVKVPIVIHTHNTTGTGDMTYLKAIEAGADIIDTAMSPLGSGTAQPATEGLVATLKGTEYDTGLDLNLLSEIAEYFRKVADRLTKDGWRDPERVLSVDVNTLRYQVPGGMLSNLIGQLKQAGKMDKYYDVLAEIPRVREDFGLPPLVTPTSQIVGTQAVMNIISGERYKMVPNESKALMMGEYGRLPAPVNEEVRRKIIGDAKVITHRPADDIPPEMDKYRKEVAPYSQQDEDALSYALFPQVATKFFETRQAAQLQVDPTTFDKKTGAMPV